MSQQAGVRNESSNSVPTTSVRLRRWLIGSLVVALAASLSLVAMGPASADPGDGTITGNVTGGGGPLAGVTVDILDPYDAEAPPVDTVTTDGDGNYSVTLAPGEYAVSFSKATWMREYYDDTREFWNSTTLLVDAEATVTADADLDPAGTISGTVSVPGNDFEGIGVTAFKRISGRWNAIDETGLDGSGNYSLALTPGTYRIGFDPGYDGLWIPEYYNDKASLRAAQNLVVTQDTPVTGIDAALLPKGTIAGTVSLAGTPSSNLEVTAYQLVDDEWEYAAGTTSGVGGNYTLHLLPGTYRIGFENDEESGWSREFYNNQVAIDDAQDLVVTSGVTVDDVDADLTPVTSKITGHVTGENGNLQGIWVYAVTLEGGDWDSPAYDQTDAQGNYELNLPAGSYRVCFDASGSAWQDECYNDQPTPQAAQLINVGENQTINNIDAELIKYPSKISGQVTADGNPLEDARISVYQSVDGDWTPVKYASTDESGDYTVWLSAGTYKLRFQDSTEQWSSEYYNDQATLAAAQSLAITNGQQLVNVNAELGPRGDVTGHVTGDGNDLDHVQVTAYQLEGGEWDWANSTYTYPDGTYSLSLEAGSYRLEFDNGSEWISEYYDDKATLASAQDVTVTSGGVTSEINADLAPKIGGVSGHVVGDGDAISDISVSAYKQAGLGWSYVDGTSTDAAGAYELRLVPGTYRIEFEDDLEGEWATEYYNDKATIEAAQNVTVSADSITTNIDADLAEDYPLQAITNSAPRPTITGTPTVGQTLHANVGTWTPSDVSLTYRWYAGDDDEQAGSGPDLLVTSAMVGKELLVEVVATKPGHRTYSKASVWSAAVVTNTPSTCQQAQSQLVTANQRVAGANAELAAAQQAQAGSQGSLGALKQAIKKAKGKKKKKKLRKRLKPANAAIASAVGRVTTAQSSLTAAQAAAATATAAVNANCP